MTLVDTPEGTFEFGEPFTMEALLDTMAEVVAAKGTDFVYNPDGEQSCQYVPVEVPAFPGDPRTTTGCLIGEVFKARGFDPEYLNAFGEGTMGVQTLGTGFTNPLARLLFVDLEAVGVAAVAQNRQDFGDTWGAALEAAQQLGGSLIALREDMAP